MSLRPSDTTWQSRWTQSRRSGNRRSASWCRTETRRPQRRSRARRRPRSEKTLDAASTPAPPEASKLTPIEPPKFANRKETPVHTAADGSYECPNIGAIHDWEEVEARLQHGGLDLQAARAADHRPCPGRLGTRPFRFCAVISTAEGDARVASSVRPRRESAGGIQAREEPAAVLEEEKSQAAGFTGEKSLPSSSKKEKKQAAASKKEKMQAAESMREKSQPVASEREQSPPTESKKEKKAKAKAKAKAMAMAAPSQASDVTVKKVTPIPVPQIGKTQNHRDTTRAGVEPRSVLGRLEGCHSTSTLALDPALVWNHTECRRRAIGVECGTSSRRLGPRVYGGRE